MPIHIIPSAVLKTVAAPIEGNIGDDLRKLMDDMLETMYGADGIGLAAPQVGISKRVVVIDIARRDDEDAKGAPLFLVNPEIIRISDTPNVYNEGCLSIPGQYAEIERPKTVAIKYIGYDGKQHELEADGLLATCIQHEIDHLDGILFIDHISTLKRDMIVRKLKKFVRENAEDLDKTHIL
jgi:peptide deformylase